jgi:hypothetical protein
LTSYPNTKFGLTIFLPTHGASSEGKFGKALLTRQNLDPSTESTLA